MRECRVRGIAKKAPRLLRSCGIPLVSTGSAKTKEVTGGEKKAAKMKTIQYRGRRLIPQDVGASEHHHLRHGGVAEVSTRVELD